MENYGDRMWYPELFESYPLLTLSRRMKSAFFSGGNGIGRYNVYSLETAPAVGTSNQVGTSVTNARKNQFGSTQAYQIPPVSMIATVSMPTLSYAQAMTDEHAFVTAYAKQARDAAKGILQQLGPQLYGLGSGVLGQIASISTTTNSNDTISLTLPDNLINFYQQSSYCDFAAGATSGAYRTRNSGNTTGLQVVAIDRVNNKIQFAYTITDGTNGTAGVIVGDYIFNATSDTTVANTNFLIGLEAICPAGGVTNSADAFFNVNRFTAGNLAYGVSYNGTSDSDVMVMINKARARSKRAVGGKQDTFICSPGTMMQARNQLNTKNRNIGEAVKRPFGTGWTDLPEDMQPFVEGIDVGGGAMLVEDINCPANRIWGCMQNDLEYSSMNDGLQPNDWDGLTLHCGFVAGVDSWEQYNTAIHNFFVRRPRNLLNIQCTPAPY